MRNLIGPLLCIFCCVHIFIYCNYKMKRWDSTFEPYISLAMAIFNTKIDPCMLTYTSWPKKELQLLPFWSTKNWIFFSLQPTGNVAQAWCECSRNIKHDLIGSDFQHVYWKVSALRLVRIFLMIGIKSIHASNQQLCLRRTWQNQPC